MKQQIRNTISHTINRHYGLDPQSPIPKASSSRLGDGGSLSAMTTKALAMIIIATLMISCEKEIEFNGDQTDSKLVINSLVEPGKPVSANISKSVFFLDNNGNTTAPDDLVASLSVNGNLIGEMIRQIDTVWNGWYDYDDQGNMYQNYRIVTTYCNDYCPAVGDVVKITASANGFDDVEGETSSLPGALSCAITNSRVSNWESYYEPNYHTEIEDDSVFYAGFVIELTIEITDANPGQTDYYRLRVDNGSKYDGVMNYLSYFAEYSDPVFGSLVAENDYFDFSDLDMAPEGVFTDVLFDGRSYQIKVPISVSLRRDDEYDPDFFRFGIALEHMGKEYYYYLNTCKQIDEVLQFFMEPVQTYSNVKGGYGLVSGLSIDSLWFPVPFEP